MNNGAWAFDEKISLAGWSESEQLASSEQAGEQGEFLGKSLLLPL